MPGMGLRYVQIWVQVPWNQKRASDPLERESQTIMSHLTRVLRIELGSSSGAGVHSCPLSHWLSSLILVKFDCQFDRICSHQDQFSSTLVKVFVGNFDWCGRALFSLAVVWCIHTTHYSHNQGEKNEVEEASEEPASSLHFLSGCDTTRCLARLLSQILQLAPTCFPHHASPATKDHIIWLWMKNITFLH